MSVFLSVSLSSVCLSVTKTPQPLRIVPISHQAYRPWSLLTIKPIDHRAYQPASLLTIEPFDHWAFWPLSLLTIKPINYWAHWAVLWHHPVWESAPPPLDSVTDIESRDTIASKNTSVYSYSKKFGEYFRFSSFFCRLYCSSLSLRPELHHSSCRPLLYPTFYYF